MADKCVESLQPEIGREICLVKGENGEYRGYQRDILVENLSERESTMFVCVRCRGIMRKACISSGVEQFCSCCKKESEQTHPNLQTDNMVLSFKCSCPLIGRGCGWLGTLGNCEDHLDTCGYVYEACELNCGVVSQRDELRIHEKENCPLRIVVCEHCHKEFKSCELTTHLEMCPKKEVTCELKCGKVMRREIMAQHLKQDCGLVVEACKLGCGMKLTRDEFKIHVTATCVQRLIACEHCKEDFKFCDMSAHLDVCPKMKVSCDLNCGVIMCREDITQHLEQDCVEREVMCPFAKYKCVGLIKRKDLSKHLEERRMEHLELRQEFIESEVIVKQNEKISDQSATIETMSREITSLKKEKHLQDTTIEFMSREITSSKKEVESFKHLSDAGVLNIPIKLEWRITEAPGGLYTALYLSIQKRFQVAGYELKFTFCYTSLNSLQILISPQNGCNYDKLKWPFKAEFITRLSSQLNPEYTQKFKSEVFVVKRESFKSESIISFRIATFLREEFLRKYSIDGEAVFEIFAFLL